MKNKILIISVIIAAASCLLIFLFYNSIIDFVVKKTIQNNINKELKLEDGLHVILIGTGSPLPDLNRAGPCVAVSAGKKLFIVDAGDGAAKKIQLTGLQIGKIEAVFLTHFHSDHIGGLGEIMLQRWAAGMNKSQLPVYGPAGVEKVVAGFNTAYEIDKGYRVAHHGPEIVPPGGSGGAAKTINLDSALTAAAVVYKEHGVTITAFNVDHFPVVPAVGYKFEYKGKSIVITGDTKYSKSLELHAKGADILFSEMLNVKLVELMNKYALNKAVKAVTHDILSYHISPEQAAQIAYNAQIKNLVFYHIIPPMPEVRLKFLYLGDAKKYFDNPITMGEDGMHFFLPPGTERIEKENLLKKKGEI
jgi:ribonuclease Z